MLTLSHLTACLIAVASSTWDVTTGATCQPHKAVTRSGSTWWDTGLGARATQPTPTGFNATADVTSGAVDEDVVFSLAVQTNASSSETTFVNLTAADLILFLQCLVNSSSQVCDVPSNYNLYSPDVSQMNHTTYNLTCTLNTTTLQCMTSIDPDIEPFGMFKLIHPGMNEMNATVYLSIDSTLTLISIQWTDLRYIHFVCLYRDNDTETVDWVLVYNIIGASMAFVVLALVIVTVWQSSRARSRHRKEMDSATIVKVELDKMKKSHIQSNLETNSTNTLSLTNNQYTKDRDTSSSSCLVPELNFAFEQNDESLHTTRF